MSLVEWLFKIFSVLLWLAAYQWLCFVHGGHQVFQPLRGHGPDCCPYHHAQCFRRWVVWLGTCLCLLCWLFSNLSRKSVVVQQMRGHSDERLLITIVTIFPSEDCAFLLMHKLTANRVPSPFQDLFCWYLIYGSLEKASVSRGDSLHELRACFKPQHAWIFTLWRPLYALNAAVSISEMNYINGKIMILKKKKKRSKRRRKKKKIFFFFLWECLIKKEIMPNHKSKFSWEGLTG